MHTFSTPGAIAATMVVAGARVRITASDRSDTGVPVEPLDKTSRSDVKVVDRTQVEFTGGQLSVKTTVPGSKKGSVAITIDLPTGSGLSPTSRTQPSRPAARSVASSCTWPRAGSSLPVSTRCGPTSPPVRSRSATSPGALTSTAACSRCGSTRSRVRSASRARSERGAAHDLVSWEQRAGRSDDEVMVHARTRRGDIVVQRVAPEPEDASVASTS